jgi:hypothetical protein
VVEAYANDCDVKINASDKKMSRIAEVFDLRVNNDNRWSLADDSLVEVPVRLSMSQHLRAHISMLITTAERNLRDLKEAFYDDDSEATCRIAVDIMLVQCRKYLRNNYQSTYGIEVNVADATNPSTSRKAVDNMPATEPMKRVKLYTESSLSIEMPNKLVPNGKILVTSRADWTLGYNTTGEEGSPLVAIEAKEESEFSKGQAQLTTYLAILRENRKGARKTNVTTQGFHSNGMQFAFIRITKGGSLRNLQYLTSSVRAV